MQIKKLNNSWDLWKERKNHENMNWENFYSLIIFLFIKIILVYYLHMLMFF